MLISNTINASDKMSPYPFKKFPFRAVNTKGEEIIISPGTSVPDLLQIFYGAVPVETTKLPYGFVSRDDKQRAYKPGLEDPFVFHGEGSKHEFFKASLELRAMLMKFWVEMELPVQKDEKRELLTTNTEELIKASLQGDEKSLAKIEKHYNDIIFTTSNLDIANKFCLVRSVSPGWWCHSYAGKQPPKFEYLKESIAAHMYAIEKHRKSSLFSNKLKEFTASNGDPLETNPGYFNYNASGTKTQLPAGKLEIINALSQIGTQGYDWNEVVKQVVDRAPDGPLKAFPFAVALLRRLQAGLKNDRHIFDINSTGMRSAYDVQGMNSIRIAFIFPYMMNLMLTPLQLRLKTAKFFLPGAYHDAEIKINRAQGYMSSQSLAKNPVFMAEADFSNYDRYLWIGIMNFIISSCYGDPVKKKYYTDMFTHTYTKMPLIYPDYSTKGSTAHIVVPPSLGLLSGAKPTGEVGTFYNSIVTGAGLLNKNILSYSEYKDYLSENYRNGKPGSLFEHNLFQSDDNLIQSHSILGLLKKMDSFKEAVETAGLKASIEIGDRFLMRETVNGADLPVESRVYQNTLSGEDGVKDPIKFMVGFAMRTDGMLGLKSVDPFNSGHVHTITAFGMAYGVSVIKKLRNFFATASIPVQSVIDLADMLILAGESALSKAGLTHSETDVKQYIGKRVKGDQSYLEKLTRMREHAVHVLAQMELNSQNAQLFNENKSLISALKLDSNVPSQAFLLEQLIKIDSSYANAVTAMDQKEHKFFKYAMTEMNLLQELDYND